MNELYGRALARLRSAHVMDPWMGHGQAALLADVGLDLLGSTIADAVAGPGDVASEWDRANVTAALPRLVAAGVLDEEFLTLAHRFFSSAGTVVTTLSVGAAWGVRAGVRSADSP